MSVGCAALKKVLYAVAFMKLYEKKDLKLPVDREFADKHGVKVVFDSFDIPHVQAIRTSGKCLALHHHFEVMLTECDAYCLMLHFFILSFLWQMPSLLRAFFMHVNGCGRWNASAE